MADLNQILTELYKMQEVDDCIRKVVDPRHVDDFKQELFIRLMEFPEGITEAYEQGRHKFYLVRVILNMATFRGDIYQRNYKKKEFEELPDREGEYCSPSDFEIRKIKEEDEIKLIDRIKNIEQETGRAYYRMMIEAVMRCGSYREVSRQTGIPKSTIHSTMKLIRKHLLDAK